MEGKNNEYLAQKGKNNECWGGYARITNRFINMGMGQQTSHTMRYCNEESRWKMNVRMEIYEAAQGTKES